MKSFKNYLCSFGKMTRIFLKITALAALFSLFCLAIYIVSNTAANIFLSPGMYFGILEEILRYITISLFFILLFDYAERKGNQS